MQTFPTTTENSIETRQIITESPPNLWVIDDDVALRMILEDALSDLGYEVATFGNAKTAWQMLQNTSELPQVILTDIRMPLMDGLTFSDNVAKQFPQIPIIIMTAHADVQSAVDSYQTGAFDYLPKPFDLDDLAITVKKAFSHAATFNPPNPTKNLANDEKITAPSPLMEKNAHNNLAEATEGLPADTLQSDRLGQHAHSKSVIKDNPNAQTFNENMAENKGKTSNPSLSGTGGIVGQSPAMQTVFRAIGRLSNTHITVLITGESGTGKELIAQALHQHSPRKNKPFIALNMAAIPHDLIEAELFGHEKGAFTGATTTRQGRFEQAHGGTLFLDEIGDMPLPTQTRLLRVLANGEFFRVGGQKPIKVDVRIIAATHQHLESLVKQGKFREDLFYRLNVIRLSLPALRERREDIPLLVAFLLQDIAKKMQLPPKVISADTMQVLQAFDWQGNVRQLENACRWLMVMATGNVVSVDDLPPELVTFYQQQYLPNSHKNAAHLQDVASHTAASNMPVTNIPVINTPATAKLTHQDGQTVTPQTCLANREVALQSHNYPREQPKTVENLTTINPSQINASQTLATQTVPLPASQDWLTPLKNWASIALQSGEQQILQTATLEFEKCLLEAALAHTKHHKGQSAELLGWGRNTLTRKYQQLIEES